MKINEIKNYINNLDSKEEKLNFLYSLDDESRKEVINTYGIGGLFGYIINGEEDNNCQIEKIDDFNIFENDHEAYMKCLDDELLEILIKEKINEYQEYPFEKRCQILKNVYSLADNAINHNINSQYLHASRVKEQLEEEVEEL